MSSSDMPKILYKTKELRYWDACHVTWSLWEGLFVQCSNVYMPQRLQKSKRRRRWQITCWAPIKLSNFRNLNEIKALFWFLSDECQNHCIDFGTQNRLCIKSSRKNFKCEKFVCKDFDRQTERKAWVYFA